MSKVWQLIKDGDYVGACQVADDEFRENSSLHSLRNKVLALLRLSRFRDAVQLGDEIIRLSNGDTDSDFIFRGVSYWLDCQIAQAIRAWRSASSSKYTDAAGGVEVYLLLLYAAIKRSDDSLRLESNTRLADLCKYVDISNWPGPIAKFVLSQLHESDLLSTMSSQPIVRAKQLCQAEFYIGLMRLDRGDLQGFEEYMHRSISHGSVCLTKPEFYLADAEARGS